MKKKLTIVLALILAIAMIVMTGCSNKETPNEKPVEERTDEEPVEDEGSEDDEEGEVSIEGNVTEEEGEDEPDEGETPDSTVPDEILGETTETSYVNTAFGIRYDAPEGWYILTQEELGQIMGIAISSIDDDAIAEMFEDTGYAMDFYAMDISNAEAATYDNLNITIQDIGKLYGLLYNEKQVAEASLDSVKQALEAQGATVVDTELGETQFIGKTCTSLTVHSKAGDIDMYQKQVYLKEGSAMACITATTFGEDKTDEVLATFKAE